MLVYLFVCLRCKKVFCEIRWEFVGQLMIACLFVCLSSFGYLFGCLLKKDSFREICWEFVGQLMYCVCVFVFVLFATFCLFV